MKPTRFTVLSPGSVKFEIEFDTAGMSLEDLATLKAELLRKVQEAQGEQAIVYDEHHQVLDEQPSLFPDLFKQREPLPIHIPTSLELQEGEEAHKELARFFDGLFNDYPTRGADQ